MANFNRIILIGRLTRDPETRTFANGGKVVKFGFAASPFRKKNAETGRWEDEPMFIDCEAFNRGENGTLANVVEQYCRKGSLICVEGRLHLETWEAKDGGGKRSKHKVVVDAVQLLESKGDGEGHQGGSTSGGSRPATRGYSAPEPEVEHAGAGEEIPF